MDSDQAGLWLVSYKAGGIGEAAVASGAAAHAEPDASAPLSSVGGTINPLQGPGMSANDGVESRPGGLSVRAGVTVVVGVVGLHCLVRSCHSWRLDRAAADNERVEELPAILTQAVRNAPWKQSKEATVSLVAYDDATKTLKLSVEFTPSRELEKAELTGLLKTALKTKVPWQWLAVAWTCRDPYGRLAGRREETWNRVVLSRVEWSGSPDLMALAAPK
jgi:hypothetical protein